jgi:hypothetical protein
MNTYKVTRDTSVRKIVIYNPDGALDTPTAVRVADDVLLEEGAAQDWLFNCAEHLGYDRVLVRYEAL